MPYSPVTFAPLPVPLPNVRMNIPADQANQASVMDANFAKLNTELGKLPAYSATGVRVYQLATKNSGFTPGNWYTLPTSVMAPLTMTLPDCAVILAHCGARLQNQYSADATFWFQAAPSGSGWLGTRAPRVCAQGQGTWLSACELWIAGVNFTPGATITLTPQYNLSAYGGAGTATIASAQYGLVALV